jgi:hypothetical protein
MKKATSQNTSQANLSPVEQWPMLCLQELKEARLQEGRTSLGEDEKMYAQGLCKIDQAYYDRHHGICKDLIAVLKNKALSDQTRAIAVDVLTRFAEPDPNAIAAQIARAEMRQAEKSEAPLLPSPYVIRPPKSHSLAILNLLDDKTESQWLKYETRKAFDIFKRRR